MPGLVPGIHDFSGRFAVHVVDGRDRPGHDGKGAAGEGVVADNRIIVLDSVTLVL
jgi:hypothetical protein